MWLLPKSLRGFKREATVTVPKTNPRTTRSRCETCAHWQSEGRQTWRAVCELRKGVAGITARTMGGFGCDDHKEHPWRVALRERRANR